CVRGMAGHLSLGPADTNPGMWMREALRKEKFPTIHDLENPRYFPYRYGQALWAYIGGRFGDRSIHLLLRAAARSGDVDRAFKDILGVDEKTLSADWHQALAAAYAPVRSATQPPTAVGEIGISAKSRAAEPHHRPGPR